MQTPVAEYHFIAEKEKALHAVAFTSIPGAIGLCDRRYPFRAESDADRTALQDSIAAVITWAARVVQRLCGGVRKRRGWSAESREDTAQNILIDLLEVSLPKFDLEDLRAARLETFLWHCMVNSLRSHLKKLKRDRFNYSEPMTPAVVAEQRGQDLDDAVDDVAIGRIAAKVIQAPEQFLSARDAAFLRLWLDRQGATQRELAATLGLSSRQIVSNRLERIMRRTLVAVSSELAALRR